MRTTVFWLAPLILGLFITFLRPAAAAVPATYSNDNLWSSTHDQPTSFSVAPDGSTIGQTATGKTFQQINIANTHNIRLQKFIIDEAFFYISDKGIITADTDRIAIATYLTLE